MPDMIELTGRGRISTGLDKVLVTGIYKIIRINKGGRQHGGK